MTIQIGLADTEEQNMWDILLEKLDDWCLKGAVILAIVAMAYLICHG